VQSFILTEVNDCGLLIIVTSSTFHKRKDIFKVALSNGWVGSRCVMNSMMRVNSYIAKAVS